MYLLISPLLWNLAQTQGCFWQLSPWCLQLNGSFICCCGFFSPPSCLSAPCKRGLDAPLLLPFLPMLHFPPFPLLEGLPCSLPVQLTCVIISTPANEFTPPSSTQRRSAAPSRFSRRHTAIWVHVKNGSCQTAKL